MIAEPKHVSFYRRPNGSKPFNDWFSTIKDKVVKKAVYARFTRLRKGNFGEHKWLGDHLYELKIRLGPGYRIYYCKPNADSIVVLYGGVKRTQAVDIEKALFYLDKLAGGPLVNMESIQRNTVSYEEWIIERLQDGQEVALFLEAAFESISR